MEDDRTVGILSAGFVCEILWGGGGVGDAKLLALRNQSIWNYTRKMVDDISSFHGENMVYVYHTDESRPKLKNKMLLKCQKGREKFYL
jgi:hypothetical protein